MFKIKSDYNNNSEVQNLNTFTAYASPLVYAANFEMFMKALITVYQGLLVMLFL